MPFPTLIGQFLLVQGKLITSRLFEAYPGLSHQVLSQIDRRGGDWKHLCGVARNTQRVIPSRWLQRLPADYPQNFDVGVPNRAHWKRASWQLAFNQIVRAQSLEASIHVIQRIPLEDNAIFPVRSDPVCLCEQNVPSRQADGRIRRVCPLQGPWPTGRLGENYPRRQMVNFQGENQYAVARTQ